MEFDYKPNSNSYKQKKASEEKKEKVTKVVKGPVKTKKKSELAKVKDALISEDARSVGSEILFGTIIPAIGNTIVDAVTNSIRMIFGVDGRYSDNKRSGDRYVSYSKYSSSRFDEKKTTSRHSTNKFDLDSFIFETRGEAEEVLDSMDDMLDRYEAVSVSDLYDLIGERCPFTAEKYGWYNLRNASVVRVRNGYMLKLPKAVPLD